MILSIVEGFERVGKSKLIQDLSEGKGVQGVYDKTFIYKPPYAGLELKFDKTKAGWILGYSALDLIIQSGMVNQNYHMILDRHIASSWVYNRLYGEGEDVDDSVVEKDIDLLNQFDLVNHYFVTHSGVDSARNIYDNTLGKDSHQDKLDRFGGFADYWHVCGVCNDLFYHFYTKFDIGFVELHSVADSKGYIVRYI